MILSKTNVEEKAIAFYLALNTIPLSILFCNGLRIATALFRWAMRLFLTSSKDDNSIKVDALNRHVIGVGTCKADGLHMEMKGILFKMGQPKPDGDLHFNRLWIWIKDRHTWLILEPTDWDLSQKEPNWRRIQASTPGE